MMKRSSLRLAVIISIAVWSSIVSAESAKIWEEKITIPTYQVKDPDPNPRFYDGRVTQGAKGKVYPFAMSDALTGIKKDQTYQAVYLENEYIKLCVLPELGGRLYSAVDKTNGYDYFYKQQVIKPTLIGTLGAWISGGSEWNFPHHHKATTMMRMDYLIKENADGSATLWLAETELRHRFRITLAMTIHPESNVLELWINPYNPTPYVHSFLFFANPSVHVDPTYQVIFPPSVEWVTQHAKREFLAWPMANGTYGDKDYKNVDISWWKNLPKAVSFFACNKDDNFFAGYDHGRDAGTAYVANHHLTPGMKFFTFGCGPEGAAWDKMLTDEDGPYLELMAGAFSDNQPDYSWSQPFENKWAKQHWFPIRDLDNLTYANLSGALNLDIDKQNNVTVQVNTTSPQPKARIILSAQGKQLMQKRADIDPAHPFSVQLQLSSTVKKTDLRLTVENAAGQTLMAYQPQVKQGDPMPQAVMAPKRPQDIDTVEELYFTGLRLDQFYNAQIDAMPYYQEALSRDPGNYLVNTQLGIHALKGMDWEAAAATLEKAVQRVSANKMRSKYGEPLFYYGLALRKLGKTQQAKDVLYRVTWSAGWKANAYFALAEMASVAGNYEEALAHINRSLETNAQNLRAANLKAILLRKLDHSEEALLVVEDILDRNPMDLQARNERFKLARAMKDTVQAKAQLTQLNDMMKAEPETFLELACLYENVGQWDEALEVLTRISTVKHALVQYHLGYASAQVGKLSQAKRTYKQAAEIKADYGFPHRPETLDALLHAASLFSQDANVRLLLGNMLYDAQPERAIRYWQAAAQLDPKRSLTFRNLGFAFGRRDDFATSIDYYQRALSLNKTDARLLYELDVILEKHKTPLEKRLEIMAAHEKVLDDRVDTLSRQVLANIQAAHYDKAIDLLTNNHFYRWEGARAIRDYYVDPHLLRGLQVYSQGHYADALKDFQAADEYPGNLEMGRPEKATQFSKVFYLIGMAYQGLGQDRESTAYLQKSGSQPRTSLEALYYSQLALRALGQRQAADELAKTLQAESQKDEAIDFFAKFGEKRSPDMKQAEFHYIRGLALLSEAGKTEEALEQFARALVLNPSHYWAKAFHQTTPPLVAGAVATEVRIYPAPDGIELSGNFAVAIEGKPVPVYKTKVPPGDQIPRLTGGRPEFGFASLASFDMRGPVDVTITAAETVKSIKILPTSYGIVPKVHDKTITISIDKPSHVTVEVNGDWQESLHIFANPFEKDVPSPNDPDVVYFGPGVHEVTSVAVGDNKTVYIAGGAYIRCLMDPEDPSQQSGRRRRLAPSFVLRGKNMTLRGRGIIDSAAIQRKARNMIVVDSSQDVTLEGVILLDCSPWTVPIRRSDRVHVDNIKIIGWRGNSDGVDISSSRDVLVENCFMRTLDDLVVIKSHTGNGEVRNIHVRNCVLWNELAHALSIGAEVRENVTNVLFEDCDIIHDVGRETALRIYHCDDAVISDVTFQNIRIEEARRLISCWIGTTRWTETKERGHIKNVVFKNITANSAPIDPTLFGFQDSTDFKPYIIKDHASIELVGFDEDHIVENVLFDNVVLDGKKLKTQQVMMNDFVEDVRFN